MNYGRLAKLFLGGALFINILGSRVVTAYFSGLLDADIQPNPYAGLMLVAFSAASALIAIMDKVGK